MIIASCSLAHQPRQEAGRFRFQAECYQGAGRVEERESLRENRGFGSFFSHGSGLFLLFCVCPCSSEIHLYRERGARWPMGEGRVWREGRGGRGGGERKREEEGKDEETMKIREEEARGGKEQGGAKKKREQERACGRLVWIRCFCAVGLPWAALLGLRPALLASPNFSGATTSLSASSVVAASQSVNQPRCHPRIKHVAFDIP